MMPFPDCPACHGRLSSRPLAAALSDLRAEPAWRDAYGDLGDDALLLECSRCDLWFAVLPPRGL